MQGFAETIRKHPYLSYDEQMALEIIIDKMASGYPMVSGIVLYGSKARGDFLEDSDIDLLFVTDREMSRAKKFEISDAIYESEVEHDVVVSVVFAEAGDFEKKNLPFLKRIRSEGIPLWSRE